MEDYISTDISLGSLDQLDRMSTVAARDKVVKYLSDWNDEANSDQYSQSDLGYDISTRSSSPEEKTTKSTSPGGNRVATVIPTRTLTRNSSSSSRDPLQFVAVKTNPLAVQAKKVIEVAQKSKARLSQEGFIVQVVQEWLNQMQLTSIMPHRIPLKCCRKSPASGRIILSDGGPSGGAVRSGPSTR